MLKDSVAKVYKVLHGSIAEEAGIQKEDTIVSINGEKIVDIFDYRFLISDEHLLIEVQKRSNEIWEIEIDKAEYEDIGIEFESSLIDEAKRCSNNCIFCFIDQLPPRMRDTLYFKDDDTRLSFLTGNYVTLTNMNDEEIDRIVKYKMSPVNISVHTTNPKLRAFMLNNKSAGDILEKIKKISSSGITINCQIVLCKGINDRIELDKTIYDLTSLYPQVKSISIVPVGITKYREGLYNLEPFNRAYSKLVIAQVERWQKKLIWELGSNVVYLADEFYLLSDTTIPKYRRYGEFPQIENGVGLVAMLKHEFYKHFKDLKENSCTEKRNISIATGMLVYKLIKSLAEELQNKYEDITVNVYSIRNNYFGENVTVTGLLTGIDICSQLRGKALGDELLICKCMLRAGERLFLDDYTVEKLEKQLNIPIVLVDNNGTDFIDKIIGFRK